MTRPHLKSPRGWRCCAKSALARPDGAGNGNSIGKPRTQRELISYATLREGALLLRNRVARCLFGITKLHSLRLVTQQECLLRHREET